MFVTFFGHSYFSPTEENERKILNFLEEIIGDRIAYAYLGNLGGFDEFAYDCCKKYKENHSNLSLIYVTPYMTINFQEKHIKQEMKRYDAVLYPEIEDKPIRFAISYRNKFMVEESDYVITYVSHDWGGAYTAYKYAKRKGKHVFNLADFDG